MWTRDWTSLIPIWTWTRQARTGTGSRPVQNVLNKRPKFLSINANQRVAKWNCKRPEAFRLFISMPWLRERDREIVEPSVTESNDRKRENARGRGVSAVWALGRDERPKNRV